MLHTPGFIGAVFLSFLFFFFSPRMAEQLFGVTQGKIPDSRCPVAPATIMARHAEPRIPLTL